MKRKIFTVVLFLLVSFLFSQESNEPSAKTSKLVIYRPSRIYGMAASQTIELNQSLGFNLGNGEYVILNVQPGEYLLYSATASKLLTGKEWNAILVVIAKKEEIYLELKLGYAESRLEKVTEVPDLSEMTQVEDYKNLRKDND